MCGREPTLGFFSLREFVSCRYCDAKSGATYPTALRPVRFTHHFTTLTAPPNSPLASTCGARAALLSDRAVSSWQALETQPRHSAQRVVKKVLRIAGGRAGRKLWFMAVLAVDKIAFCSRDWLTRPIAFCSREVLRPRHHRRSPVKRCCW